MAGSASISVALGMWCCRYRELQPVFFGGRNDQGAAEEGQAGPSFEGGGDDAVFSRGRGRGRGKDGNGEYELAEMKHTA